MLDNFKHRRTQDAFDTPFDPTNDPDCGLTSEDTQSAIEELCNRVSVSASPGFTFGDSGNISANSWLLNDTVPSNKTGRLIYLNNAIITSVFVSNENPNTFDVEVYEHDGSTFTLLYTLNVVASRQAKATGLTIALTTDKELAIKIVGGSAKNPVVGLQLSGTI